MALVERDAADLAASLARGELSAVEVMAAFLDRIDAVNPALNAIVSLRERSDLLAEARTADRAGPGGPLHGLPIAVKDLQATAGIRTTWGSPIFAEHVPKVDEALPRRLRAAGAILIGKTNVPEWGMGSHSFNPVFGVTRNPYDPARTAGGSSGGAGAALAARMLPLADGSDAMGSLRNPAAFCNVYGFRPSVGLVPGDPVGDIFGPGLATDGPMGRSPGDVALLLSVIAGRDPRLPWGLDLDDGLDLSGEVTGTRIGWLGDWGGAWPFEDGILDLCQQALGILGGLGCVVEPVAAPHPAEALWEAWTTLRSANAAARLGEHYDDTARRDLLKPEAVFEVERGRKLSALDMHRASVLRSEWFVTLAGLFERFDVLVLPSAQVWPFPVEWRWPESVAGQPMDTYHRWMQVMMPVSLAGVPCLGTPAGFGANGLPMGIQLFGPRGADREVLRLGQAYHAATDWPGRRPPP